MRKDPWGDSRPHCRKLQPKLRMIANGNAPVSSVVVTALELVCQPPRRPSVAPALALGAPTPVPEPPEAGSPAQGSSGQRLHRHGR